MKFSVLASTIIFSNANAQNPKGEVYLTFDDGPIDATEGVLDVLEETGVKVTFFLNGFHLFGEGDENEDFALKSLKRTVADGHIIANHSYNHMLHNCCREGKPEECGAAVCNEIAMWNVRAYQDEQEETALFSFNTKIIRHSLKGATHGEIPPNDMLHSMGRLPYTNSWRLEGTNSDCACCTTDDVPPWDATFVCSVDDPTYSSAISGMVADNLYAGGMDLYGWDVEWSPDDWTSSDAASTLTSAEDLAETVMALADGDKCEQQAEKANVAFCDSSHHRRKVVILTHDFLFEDGGRGTGATTNLPKLRDFIGIMRSNGYVFKTLDEYGTSISTTSTKPPPKSFGKSGKKL